MAYSNGWILGSKRAGACLLAFAATACTSGGSEPITTAGELGNGRFRYVCIYGRDAQCEQTEESAFPDGIAVGGQFVLEYESDEPGLSATVVSAIPEILTKDSDVFTVLQPGFAAALAKLPTGEIVDIKHMRGRSIAKLEIHTFGVSPIESIEVEAGEVQQVWARPTDSLGRMLAGALEYSWTSEDETIVEVEALDGDERASLRGISEGMAEVLVSVGDVVASLEVTVTAGTGETDSGDSGSEGTDTDESDSGDSDSGDSGSGSEGGTGSSDSGGSTESGADESSDASDGTDESGSDSTDTDTTTNIEEAAEGSQ